MRFDPMFASHEELGGHIRKLEALNAELLTALKTHLPGHLKGIENCPTCAALIKKAEAQK